MPPTQPPGVPDGVRVLEAEVIKLKWTKSSDLHDFGREDYQPVRTTNTGSPE